MNRRDFLKTAALATATLPLMAESEPVEVVRFLHITDSHFDTHHPQTMKMMEKLLKALRGHYRDVDFVLFGGDNFNNNAPGRRDAELFKSYLDKLPMPAYLVRGNKESSPKGDPKLDAEGFKALFFGKDLSVSGGDWALERKGVVILGLDSCVEGHNNGRYTPKTLDFAESWLKKGRPTVILNHHPYLNYWGGTDPKDLHKYVHNNTQEVQKRLFGYDNLVLTLSGHRLVST
ncbi:metallophosphoesterase [Hydrogenimonas sp.]